MRTVSLTLVLAASALSAQAPSYHISRTYPLGGDGGWDYIVPDPAAQRVYIGRANRVMVVDAKDGKLLGEVTGIKGAHGTAIAESGQGYATSGNDSAVVVFDLKTFAPLARLHAAEDADAIVYDPTSKRVFTLNGDAHSSTVIDAVAGSVIKSVDLGGKPEYGATALDGKVYANLTDVSQVVEIDAKSLTVTKRWSTEPCKQPVAMAIDRKNHRLFSGCRSGVMAVSDYASGKLITTLPIGKGVDGAGYDPATGDAFASCVDGTLTVIHQDGPDAYRVTQTLTTMPNSRNMGLDPTTHRIYIAGAEFEALAPGARGRAPVKPGTFVLMVIER